MYGVLDCSIATSPFHYLCGGKVTCFIACFLFGKFGIINDLVDGILDASNT